MEKAVSDLNDLLLDVRHSGIGQLPEAGDSGDDRVRALLEREIADPRPLPRRTRRRLALGGVGVTPAVLAAIVATAAAATGGAVFVAHSNRKQTTTTATTSVTNKHVLSALALFRLDPGSPFAHRKPPRDVLYIPQTVIPATVRMQASAVVPDYGTVQFWAARTKQGGACGAIKLPDGAWAAYPFTRHMTGGLYGGTVPGCIDTDQQRSIGEHGQPSAEAPTVFQGDQDQVKSRNGRIWELFYGYVTTQGRAVKVQDPPSGRTAPVMPDGYFLFVEPPSTAPSPDPLNVLNAAGQQLQPDYTRAGLLPGYRMGPTSGPSR